jgi:hypothetical protein
MATATILFFCFFAFYAGLAREVILAKDGDGENDDDEEGDDDSDGVSLKTQVCLFCFVASALTSALSGIPVETTAAAAPGAPAPPVWIAAGIGAAVAAATASVTPKPSSSSVPRTAREASQAKIGKDSVQHLEEKDDDDDDKDAQPHLDDAEERRRFERWDAALEDRTSKSEVEKKWRQPP